MVKPLSFKGDQLKKRKRNPDGTNYTPATAADDSPQPSKIIVRKTEHEEDATEDDSWVSAELVSDIAGPIVLLLPTQPLTCLATDATGKTFASSIQNLVEDEPFATAEPHDVRQVWVANRVAGTESYSFKAHHGRYLACDKFGVVAALREAAGPEESWTLVQLPEHRGGIALQTVREKFLSVVDVSDGVDVEKTSIRGDADEAAFGSTLHIRMQARFKPRLKKSKEDKASTKITRKELETAVGRKLENDEVKNLKKARRQGNYHEAILDVKIKGKHDKFA